MIKMNSLTVTNARAKFSELVDQVAFHGERILLLRNGKEIAAIVPAEEANLLEAMEDKMDLEIAEQRLRDGKPAIPYSKVRAELGLD